MVKDIDDSINEDRAWRRLMDEYRGRKKAKKPAVRLIGRHPFPSGIARRRMRNAKKGESEQTDGNDKKLCENYVKTFQYYCRLACKSFDKKENYKMR